MTRVTTPDTPATQLPRLSRATVPESVLGHSRGTPATGIVHIGLGNFHRAHLAVYTAKALAEHGGDWGIFAYSMRSATVPNAMAAQDLLYSVVDIAPGTEAVTVPAVHSGALGGDADPARVVDQIGQEATRIVTLTVTEAGYTLSPRTGGLDTELPQVQADLAGTAAPRTAVGLVARGLQQRARRHGAPATVLSCDNLSDNGDLTRLAVRQFAEALPEAESAELLAYLGSSVTFPNSMVDRIVPSTDDRHRELAAERLGVVDAVPVPAEPFTMWVVQDRFAGGRPAWEAGGAIFTDDVTSYELMKLRLLNGTHSLLAYLGALDGRATIPDARFQDFIEQAARTLMYEEYLPTLTLPEGVDADDYVEQLFSRWGNTVLADTTTRVGSDGSVKLPQRITEPVRQHGGAGVLPEHICLTVAGYLACHAPLPGFEPGPYARAMADPAKERLAALAAESADPHALVGAVFERGGIFPPVLAEQPGFVERVGTYLALILDEGVRAAAQEAQRSTAGR